MSIPYAVFKDRMKRLNLESKLPMIFRDSKDFDDKKMFRSYQRKSAKRGNKLQKFSTPKANQMVVVQCQKEDGGTLPCMLEDAESFTGKSGHKELAVQEDTDDKSSEQNHVIYQRSGEAKTSTIKEVTEDGSDTQKEDTRDVSHDINDNSFAYVIGRAESKSVGSASGFSVRMHLKLSTTPDEARLIDMHKEQSLHVNDMPSLLQRQRSKPLHQKPQVDEQALQQHPCYSDVRH